MIDGSTHFDHVDGVAVSGLDSQYYTIIACRPIGYSHRNKKSGVNMTTGTALQYRHDFEFDNHSIKKLPKKSEVC